MNTNAPHQDILHASKEKAIALISYCSVVLLTVELQETIQLTVWYPEHSVWGHLLVLFVKDVIWVTGEFKALLPRRILERRWGSIAIVFAGFFNVVIWGQVIEP